MCETGLQLSNVLKPLALQEFCSLAAVNRTLIELSVDGTSPVKGSVALLGEAIVKVRFLPSIRVCFPLSHCFCAESGALAGGAESQGQPHQ